MTSVAKSPERPGNGAPLDYRLQPDRVAMPLTTPGSLLMAPHYRSREILAAYHSLGIAPGDTVYVTGNFGNLGFHESMTKTGTLNAHLEALQTALGRSGTVTVPTHSFSLCNTDQVFDPETTPSERGPFTEFVRRQPDCVRQFHPFASVTALGARAHDLCSRCTRHAYGPNTPFARMLAENAWFVSAGMLPQMTCSIVHHVEMAMGVPYRYTKEFMHSVRRPSGIETEPFYLFVGYQDAELERDRNEKIFQQPHLRARVRQASLGMNHIWAYRMKDFERAAIECMTDDIYAWLKRPPTVRPYLR